MGSDVASGTDASREIRGDEGTAGNGEGGRRGGFTRFLTKAREAEAPGRSRDPEDGWCVGVAHEQCHTCAFFRSALRVLAGQRARAPRGERSKLERRSGAASKEDERKKQVSVISHAKKHFCFCINIILITI